MWFKNGCIYKINDISAATYHRLLNLIPNKSLAACLLFHGQIYKLSYLQNFLFHEYKKKVKKKNKKRSLNNLNRLISTLCYHCCMLLCHQWSVMQFDKSIHPVVLYLHVHEYIWNREKEGKSSKNYQGMGAKWGGWKSDLAS